MTQEYLEAAGTYTAASHTDVYEAWADYRAWGDPLLQENSHFPYFETGFNQYKDLQASVRRVLTLALTRAKGVCRPKVQGTALSSSK